MMTRGHIGFRSDSILRHQEVGRLAAVPDCQGCLQVAGAAQRPQDVCAEAS